MFLRHGETLANLNQFACGGDQDENLIDSGRQQVREAAGVLQSRGYMPHLIITSPISRTAESASIIKEELNPEAEILYEPALRERLLGDWNGKSHSIVNPLLAAGETPRNGESAADFRDRVARCFNRLLECFERWPLIIANRGHARLLLETVGDSEARFFPNGKILKVSVVRSDEFEVRQIERL